MSENVQKGWLNTRDGDKFAPITLVENVYTRNNQPYDERVREYIAALQKNSSTSVTSLQVQVSQNVESIKSLQQSVIDVDKKFDEKLANINYDDQTDTLFIIDNDNNVIAYVDKDGVHSTDMILNSGGSLSTAITDIDKLESSTSTLASNLDTFKASLSNIKANEEVNDTLYITDGVENVIAYVNKDGVHSINFLTDDTIDYKQLVEKVEENKTSIDSLLGADNTLSARVESLNTKLIAIENAFKHDEYTDAFYIVDSNNNVIFYANKDGIHSVNLHIDGARDYLHLDQTVTNIQGNITDLQKADEELDKRLDKEEAITSTYGTQLNNLETKTANQGVDYSEALYIVDKDNNVVAYFNDSGLYVINVHSGASGETQYDLNSSLASIYNTQKNLDEAIKAEAKTRASEDDLIDTKAEANKTELLAISKVLGYSETGEIFYFMDNNDNVIAYINDEGLHVVNVLVGATEGTNKTEYVYNLYDKLTALIAASSDHTEDIAENAKQIGLLKTKDEALAAEDKRLSDAIDTLQNKVANVSNVMDFIGSFSTLPSVANYQNGDVCIVGNKEYILWDNKGTKTWVEFGDTSEENAAISKLQKIVGDPNSSSNLDTSHETRLDKLDTLTSGHSSALNNLSAAIGWENSDSFYFMDKDNNVIAYIDSEGFHVVNVLVGATEGANKTENIYDLYSKLTEIFATNKTQDINIGENAKQIGILQAKDATLDSEDLRLSGLIRDLTKVVDDEIKAREEADEAFVAEDKRLDGLIGDLTESLKKESEVRLAQDTALQEEDKRLNNEIVALQGKVENVSTIMDFIGTFAELPAVASHQKGDVCIIGNKEYIHNGSQWIEFGDTSEEVAAISKLQSIVGDPSASNNSDTSHETRLDKLDTLTNNHTSTLNDLSTVVGWENSDSLYIVDKDNNVVAYFDDEGLHAINILLGASIGENKTEHTYDLYNKLTELIAISAQHKIDIDENADEIKKLKTKDEALVAEDGRLSELIDNFQQSTTQEFNALKNKDEELKKEDERLSGVIEDFQETVNEEIKTLKAKDEALVAEDGRLSELIKTLQDKVTNVSTVMDFVGAFTEKPAIADYQKGDVCVVGNKEYVHDGSQWVEIGDTSAEATAISKLQGIVGDPNFTTNASTTHEARLDALDALASNHGTTLADLGKAIGWTNSDTLYIMDNNDNVIAHFNKDGLTVTNVIVKDKTSTTEVVKNAKDQMTYLKKGNSFTVTWSIPL